MLLAVFGDLHGQLAAAYDALAHWEHHHDEQIDAVRQTGDLGAIHDASGIDGATFRHFLQDPTELGGLLYLHGILQPTHPTYFVRGNHEDFDHLLEHKGKPVDPAGKLVHLWATDPIELEGGDGTTCRIAGLGEHKSTHIKVRLPAGLHAKARSGPGMSLRGHCAVSFGWAC